VRIQFVGDRSGLSDKVRAGLLQAEAATAGNSRLVFNVCFNYGGRWDIAQAAAAGRARRAITEQSLDRAMALAHVPDPDLLIRTGGEKRISNFLLWQAAYSELYFSDKLWPEFDAAALDAAIADYASASAASARPRASAAGGQEGRLIPHAQAARHHRRRAAGHPAAGAVLAHPRTLPGRRPGPDRRRRLGMGPAERLGQGVQRRLGVACVVLCAGAWGRLVARPLPGLWLDGGRHRLGAGRRCAAALGVAGWPASRALRIWRRAGSLWLAWLGWRRRA
jgi:hypothetical protein